MLESPIALHAKLGYTIPFTGPSLAFVLDGRHTRIVMYSASRSIGYVLIGAGRAGAFDISAILRMPGCSLRYLVDVDADRAASRTNEYSQEQGWECLALAATEMPERSKGRRRDRRISNLLAL